ncbi:hypothetical protein JCM11491_002906 [Sporobolomyces phaffii]
MSEKPVRTLILVDGDHVAPEKTYLSCRAQGGSLIAYQLAEQCRRWVSRELGRDATVSCLLFADVAHLCRSMDLTTDAVVAFSKGFSSTPSPCAFIHVLQGTTLAAISAHLGFMLDSLDFVFLAGCGTNVHAHHLSKLFKADASVSRLAKIILLETSEPAVAAVKKLASGQARFQGLAEVAAERVENILTESHREYSDGYQADPVAQSPSASHVSPATSNVPPGPSQAPTSRLSALPGGVSDRNPWVEAQTPPGLPVPARALSTFPLADTTHSRQGLGATMPSPATLTRPPGLDSLPPPSTSHGVIGSAYVPRGASSRSSTTLTPALAHLATSSAALFPSWSSIRGAPVPRPLTVPSTSYLPCAPIGTEPAPPASASSSSGGGGGGGGRRDPGPASVSSSASSTSNPARAHVSAPASPVPPAPARAPAGTPAIPDRFLALVRLVHSHQLPDPSSSSASVEPQANAARKGQGEGEGGEGGGILPAPAPSPLWSTIGSQLGAHGVTLPKGTKLKDFLLDAQRDGWVVTGRGDGEGREWVKVSKRGERALAKGPSARVGGGGGGGGGVQEASVEQARDQSASPRKSR